MSNKRELRVLNRSFSLGEYGESWTKMERFLFIEVYNAIKDFYIDKNSENITEFSAGSITVKLPIRMIDDRLFSTKNRTAQLAVAADGLLKKRINSKIINLKGVSSFDFINMFTRIKYNPAEDKENMYVKIPSEIYEEMVPIESFCQLDLKLISEFNSGNTTRLYEIFKSYSFKKYFEISFTALRKQLGFYKEEKYSEWKHFNNKVLKPAVIDINTHKEFDIEIAYNKAKGSETVCFNIKTHGQQDKKAINVLYLNELIDKTDRKLNMIQDKYIDTLIVHCQKFIKVSNPVELKKWIVSDLINQQNTAGKETNFKRSMNEISKQLRAGDYSKPFSHSPET